MEKSINDMTPNQRALSHISDFHRLMDEKDIALVYCGEFSQELNKTLLAFTERKFKAENLEDNTRRRIFNIMVELLQNVSKNKVDLTEGTPEISAIFMLGTQKDDYLLMTSNMISNEKIPPLKSRLDQVNSLDKEGLKQLYKETRLSTTFDENSGAGIGIIDIARKAESRLEYNFEELDNKYSLFSLLIRVAK